MLQLVPVSRGGGEVRTHIIFVHGLGGDLWSTWQCGSDGRSFWPRWLADDIAGIATYVVGYDAPVSRWRGTAMHLVDRASSVLARLLAEPAIRQGRVVLIGHSLGGLIIKQLIRTAESDARRWAEAADLIARVEKIAFLATPHTGADLASLADRLRILIRPSAATASLVRNDPNLRDLNHWYRDWADAQGIPHLVLTETRPIRFLGTVVPPDSGDVGLAGYRPVPIDADHWTICRPPDRSSAAYIQVRAFIEREFERSTSAAEAKLEAVKLYIGQQNQILLEAVQREKGVPHAILANILARLGETSISNDLGQIERVLSDKADEYVSLRRQLTQLASDDPRVAELRKEAATALESADIARARAKLRDAVNIDSVSVAELAGRAKQRTLSAVRSLMESASVSRIGLNYRDGARDLDEAASLVERFDLPAAWELRILQGTDLYSQGDQFGDNQALLDAIGIYRRALTIMPREQAPRSWAMTQFNLGNALRCLGEREVGTERLEEALLAYRAVLTERAELSQEFTTLQIGLGNALYRLGQRQEGSSRLEEAVDVYREALNRLSPEREPHDWAVTQANLGNALSALGERNEGTAYFEEAVGAYREALKKMTRESAPRAWAMTQNNLGGALVRFGERHCSAAYVADAIAAFGEALTEQTQTRMPLEWAMTQHNLGTAFRTLGDRASLEQAVVAYCNALKERTRERAPKAWAETTGSLCAVMVGLAAASKEEVFSQTTLSSIEKGVSTLKTRGVAADFVIDQFDASIRDRLRAL